MTRLAVIPPVDACRLLNYVRRLHGLESDGALSRALGVQRADVSRIRNSYSGMGPSLLLRIHEYTGVPALELRAIAANGNL